ncbi:suppressor APC domain-containing protein 2 isoform X2 [Rhinoderma darwinii]|uniref:suppressor APC domain-containing protein 2 isoform X2 n=1 Tax=Rhinoderma darwinii TaxID=43563 RepID=UPI003F668E92
MEPAPSTQGLPRAFLHSLRTLFDILDDQRRGYVHIQEIETRWRGADTRALPPGVLLCLRKVAPADGYLTFERFVLGLRTSMLNSQNRENYQMGAPRVPGKVGYTCKPQPLGVRYINGTHPARCSEKTSAGGEGGVPTCRKAEPERGADRPRLAGEEVKPMCKSHSESTGQGLSNQCRHQRSRGEHRRHTITNGVDYTVDPFSEGQQTPLNQLLPKLQEVNRYLSELMTPCKAAVHSASSSVATAPLVPGQQQAVNMLKEQNRLLTKEVSDKSDRITQLEQEKSALIKQLFEARARSNQETNAMDSTFI